MSENDDPRDLDNSYKHYYAVSNDLGLNSLACGVPASHFDVINGDSEDDETEKDAQTWKQKLCHFYDKESLLIEVLLAISIAYMYPKIGDVYLFPDVTAHWIAVIIIFFLSGFSLKIHELSKAASNFKFNAFVIIYNFIGISLVVNFVAKFFYQNEIVSEDLMKGMIICSCLSMPTNMMVILAVAAKGDEALSLFLSTIMNLLGVFITPLLIFLYMGDDAEINFIQTYKSVSLRVLVPVAAGLTMRIKIQGADTFANEKKKLFQKIRERALVYIVYATFCTTFMTPSESSGGQILVMALSQIILLGASMVIAWIILFVFFNREPQLRVVGLFGCCTKTAALGIPLISAIYEDHPRLGIFTLPLLIWYPGQLIIGTLLSARLRRFVDYKLRKHELERQRTESLNG